MAKKLILTLLCIASGLLASLEAQRFDISEDRSELRNMLYFEAFKSGPGILFNWAVNSNSQVSSFVLIQGRLSEEGTVEWEEIAQVPKNSIERNTEYYFLLKKADLGQMFYRIRESHKPPNEIMAPIYKSKFF